MSTFPAATNPSANQITVMQIHYCDATWTLSNEIIFVIQPHIDLSKSRPAAGDLRLEEKVIIAVGQGKQSPCDYVIHFSMATTSRKTQEKACFKQQGDLIGGRLCPQRLLPHTSDMPSPIRRRMEVVCTRRQAALLQQLLEEVSNQGRLILQCMIRSIPTPSFHPHVQPWLSF